MRNLKSLLLLTILLSPLSVYAKNKDPDKPSEHKKILAIKELQDHVKTLENQGIQDRADIASLQKTVGNLDKADIHQMQEEVEKHGVYFAILTAFTGITAAAILGELIHRVVTRDKNT